MKFRVGILTGLLTLLAFAAYGQMSTSAGTAADGTFRGSASFSGPSFMPPAVTGAPYSGEQVSERVQTLPDGSHITQKMPGQKTWRDSQGRTRTERPMGPASMANAPAIMQITDPVAGYQYTLDPEKQVAHRVALPPPPGPRQVRPAVDGANVGAGRGAGRGMGSEGGGTLAGPPMVAGTVRVVNGSTIGMGAARPQTTNESLGTQTIDGVLVEGRRMTMVYPAGMQGNDAPITVVSETWRSPDLGLIVLSTTNDPRSGVNTMKVANLSRVEPDASLFLVPAGYSIVDETGTFTITYGGK